MNDNFGPERAFSAYWLARIQHQAPGVPLILARVAAASMAQGCSGSELFFLGEAIAEAGRETADENPIVAGHMCRLAAVLREAGCVRPWNRRTPPPAAPQPAVEDASCAP